MSYSWGVGTSPERRGGLAPLHTVGDTVLSRTQPVSAPETVMIESAAAIVPSAVEAELAVAPVSLEMRRLAAELAPMVDVWQRLLRDHTSDESGRCRTCTRGGTGLPGARWPCSIHGIAQLARHCHEAAQRADKSA